MTSQPENASENSKTKKVAIIASLVLFACLLSCCLIIAAIGGFAFFKEATMSPAERVQQALKINNVDGVKRQLEKVPLNTPGREQVEQHLDTLIRKELELAMRSLSSQEAKEHLDKVPLGYEGREQAVSHLDELQLKEKAELEARQKEAILAKEQEEQERKSKQETEQANKIRDDEAKEKLQKVRQYLVGHWLDTALRDETATFYANGKWESITKSIWGLSNPKRAGEMIKSEGSWTIDNDGNLSLMCKKINGKDSNKQGIFSFAFEDGDSKSSVLNLHQISGDDMLIGKVYRRPGEMD